MENRLDRAISLAQEGETAAARQILAQIVTKEPDNELAWAWLAHCAATDEGRRYALEQVLRINPEKQGARRELEKLGPAVGRVGMVAPSQRDPQADERMLDRQIGLLTTKGWQVTNRTSTTAQLIKSKRWNRALLLIGLATLCTGGLGLFVLAFALIDFLFKRDLLLYLTIDDIRAGNLHIPSEWSGPNKLFIIAILLLIGIIVWSVVILPIFLSALR